MSIPNARISSVYLTVLFAVAFMIVGQALNVANAQTNKASVERDFSKWLAGPIWREARKAGVSKRTFTNATKSIRLNWKLPDLRPPGAAPTKAQRQAEFRAPQRYFSENNLSALVARGREQGKKWSRTLSRIERQFGVPRGILLAIWGRETGYGRAKLRENAIEALATEAFMGRRKSFFRPQLIAALRIVDEGHVPLSQMRSSWAGALGQPQFLPTKFFQHAVDFDGDGRRDIWNSVPDTLASIANYLRHEGWQSGKDWGYEIAVPNSLPCTVNGPENRASASQWVRNGVRRISGKPFPKAELNGQASILMPAGRYGPAFLVTPNFYVLKTYNESDLYALFIGHLKDRYGNNKRFLGKWQKLSGFNREDIRQMQLRLEKRGRDVGTADGLIGFKTRLEVGNWQSRNKRPVTCFPSGREINAIR